MFVFWKIWRALFSWDTRFEIRPFGLLPTIYIKGILKSFAKFGGKHLPQIFFYRIAAGLSMQIFQNKYSLGEVFRKSLQNIIITEVLRVASS